MRPGLVAVGVSLLVLGSATVAAVYLIPAATPTSQDTTVIQPVYVGPHAAGERAVMGANTTAGTMRMSWNSTVPLSVALYEGVTCPPSGACSGGVPVANWSTVSSGMTTLTGRLVFPFELIWTNHGGSAGGFHADAVETYHTTTALPALTAVLVDGTAGALIGIGGIALFLGLFLRAGVFVRPPPPPSNGGPR